MKLKSTIRKDYAKEDVFGLWENKANHSQTDPISAIPASLASKRAWQSTILQNKANLENLK
jgi:hypothetical protein